MSYLSVPSPRLPEVRTAGVLHRVVREQLRQSGRLRFHVEEFPRRVSQSAGLRRRNVYATTCSGKRGRLTAHGSRGRHGSQSGPIPAGTAGTGRSVKGEVKLYSCPDGSDRNSFSAGCYCKLSTPWRWVELRNTSAQNSDGSNFTIHFGRGVGR